jgi:hypothetical protein
MTSGHRDDYFEQEAFNLYTDLPSNRDILSYSEDKDALYQRELSLLPPTLFRFR